MTWQLRPSSSHPTVASCWRSRATSPSARRACVGSPDTAEIKRMYVQPSHRGAGVGRALLDELITAAGRTGYERVRLDSPDFMTAAHGLYRASGFVDIGPYPESEIPDAYKSHWVFMERTLRRGRP